MPVRIGKDKKGCFAQYVYSGTKYYYVCNDVQEMNKAKRKANLQWAAIIADSGVTKEK